MRDVRTSAAEPVLRHTFQLGEFTIEPFAGEVCGPGGREQLDPKVMDVLLLLAHRAGHVVLREELLEKVWPGLVVSDDALSRCIYQLRRHLSQAGGDSQYKALLETLPKRGYRLNGPVTIVEAPSRPAEAVRRWPRWPFAVVLLLILGLAGAWWGTGTRRIEVPLPEPGSMTKSPDSALEVAESSIAVLPFANMSGDPDNEHFSDGVSEEILNRLSRFEGLRVLARTSSFAFKDSGFDVPKLSAALGVGYLLQGSIRQEGQQLRITAQLVDDSGFHVWSESYDRELGGIFALQDEIAESVAASIVPQVSTAPKEETPPDIVAYQHYLIGREILQKRLLGSAVLAAERLERAIEIDPQFAEARAELGLVLALSAGWWSDRDYAARLDRAQKEIDMALSLKPDLARAHAAQAMLLLETRTSVDEPGLEAALRRALALDPNMVDAGNWLANLFVRQGRYDEALAELERAARLDPLAPAVITNIAADYASRGAFAEAEQRLLRLLEIPQPSFYAYWSLAEFYFATGQLVEANEIAKRHVWTVIDTGRGSTPLLAWTYARLGLWEIAEYWQDRTERDWAGHILTLRGRSDLLRLRGRFAEAVAAFQANREPENIDLGGAGPDFIAEYGTVQALAGDYEAAIRTLEPLAGDASWHSIEGGIDAGHSLAWVYLQSGAPDRAQPVLETLEREFLELQAADRLHESVMLYLFAQNTLLAGDRDLAIDRLRQAVDAGWRDYYRLDPDPRWQSVREEPRLQALMRTVKADIDAQRARLEQIDAEDDFVARIDAAIAARQ